MPTDCPDAFVFPRGHRLEKCILNDVFGNLKGLKTQQRVSTAAILPAS
jgi:hypothetical protein